MKKKMLAMGMLLSLVLSMMFSVTAFGTESLAMRGRWGGDEMSDWPISISCDPDFPIFGPNVGEKREEVIQGLQEGNTMTYLKVKNYSPSIVKISKVKKNTSYGGNFIVKGLKKGYAHIKVTVGLKYAQNEMKKYVWDIKKYPVGHNDD